nr:F31 [uncultured bacterium]
MTNETELLKLWLHSRQGHVSSTYFMDEGLVQQVVRIAEASGREPGEVIEEAVRAWLKSGEPIRPKDS